MSKELYKKTYNAINYQFNKQVKSSLVRVENRVKNAVKGLGLTKKQESELLKKSLRDEKEYLRTTFKTPNQITSYARQLELVKKYRDNNNIEKLNNLYKAFSPTQQANKYKDNIGKAINELSIDNDTKNKLLSKINRLSRKKLEQYDDLFEKLFEMYMSEDMYGTEIESIVQEILAL